MSTHDAQRTLTNDARRTLTNDAQRTLWDIGRIALDFLLPPACVSCERLLDDGEQGMVCGRCWSRLALLPSPRCSRCGHPGLRKCTWCDLLPPYVSSVRSVCWMHDGTGPAMVHALKYGGWHGVAHDIAHRMARLVSPSDARAAWTALIPVPLAPSRLRERGFNQSELLARTLAAAWQIPLWCDALDRARATETQTRLTPEQRLANVSGAFRVRDAARSAARDEPQAPTLDGAHLVLVDDVVTTAATLNACAEALVAGGARCVSYVTFGRAPAIGDRK